MPSSRWKYGLAALLLLLTEIYIGLRVHDDWVRPYGGDLLATPLLYCLFRAATSWPGRQVALVVLAISFGLEALQAAHLLARLGWADCRPVRLLLGSTFSWSDLLLYALGLGAAAALEWLAGGGELRRNRQRAASRAG